MMKRRYVAMISAVLCSAMILSACRNSKKTESIYTGDKTEVPAWQANLDAISPSAYADVEGLDLEPGTYISVIGRAGGTPYWDEVKKGVEQAAEDLNESLGYSGDDKIKVVYNAPDENDNIDEMVNILDEELARYPDVIAVSSIDESASEVQFDLATANGIPIVAFDSGNSYQGIQCICRTDNKEAAKTGVKKLCEAIGDSGEIALLLNDSVSENGKEREAGVKEEIKANHPDVSVVETIYVDELDQLKRKAAAEQLGMSAEDLAAAEAGEKMDDAAQTTGTANGSGTDTAETSANGDDGTAAGGTDTATKDGATAPTVAEKFEEVKSAADKMSNEEAVAYYLKKHPELKGIFALNETSTQLGIQVLDELDNSDEIQIVGFDAGKEQVKALEDGELDGLVVQNPFGMGYAAVIASARTVLEIGNEAEVNTGYVWVTAENMDDADIKPLVYK